MGYPPADAARVLPMTTVPHIPCRSFVLQVGVFGRRAAGRGPIHELLLSFRRSYRGIATCTDSPRRLPEIAN